MSDLIHRVDKEMENNKSRFGINSRKKDEFHNKHEIFTEKAFNTPMLPDRYVFVLTNLCNLKCRFCFQKKKPIRDAMTAKDWMNLAKQLPDYARVTFTGGEPFVFPDFKDVFSYVAERFNCNIISNGILLTEEKIEYILSFPKFKVLSISIDNIGNTNRSVTPAQWDHLKKMLNYFIKKRDVINPDCILDVKTMVLDENAEDILNIYKYLTEELDVDTHAFQFLKGSSIQHADCMFKFKDILKKSDASIYTKFDIIKEQLELVRQYNVRNGNVSFLHPKVDSLVSKKPISNIDLLNNPDHVKGRYLPCKFPWSSVHINVDGTLFPCLAVSMGNVKKIPLIEIIKGEKFDNFRELIKKEGSVEACNRCGWLRPNQIDLQTSKVYS